MKTSLLQTNMSQQSAPTNVSVKYVHMIPQIDSSAKDNEWYTYVRKALPVFRSRVIGKEVEDSEGDFSLKYSTQLTERTRKRYKTRRVCVPTSMAKDLQSRDISEALSKRVQYLNTTYSLREDLPYHMSRAIDYFVFGKGKNRQTYEVVERYPDEWVLRVEGSDDLYFLPRGNYLQEGKIHNGVYYFPSYVEITLT